MVCTKCGCEQGSAAQFCRECGARMIGSAPPPPAWMPGPRYGYVPPPSMRVRGNLQPLGILWCVFGAYRLLSMLVAATVLHALAESGFAFAGMGPHLARTMHAFLPMLLLTTVVFSGAAILTGYALLTGRPWGRVLAIVVGILSLVKFPFGTALGIYTLWVLAPAASGFEWQGLTGRSAVKV
jgi:hypothetical protein